MNKITKLSFQKNINRVNVFLDDQFAFGLATEVALKRGLKTNLGLSNNDIEKLLIESISLELYNQSLRFLSLRFRSISETRLYLQKKLKKLQERTLSNSLIKQINLDFPSLINQTLTRLQNNNFLNDTQFAKWWIQQRIATKPRGKTFLKMELKHKGISNDTIKDVIEDKDLLSESTNQEMISILLEKAFKSLKNRGYDRVKLKLALTRRLIAKGFSWDEIKPQIDEFFERQYN